MSGVEAYHDYQLTSGVTTLLYQWDEATYSDGYSPVATECGVTSGGVGDWGPWTEFFVGHFDYGYVYKNIYINIHDDKATEEGDPSWVQIASSTSIYAETFSGYDGILLDRPIRAGIHRHSRPLNAARIVYARAKVRNAMPAGYIYRLNIHIQGIQEVS